MSKLVAEACNLSTSEIPVAQKERLVYGLTNLTRIDNYLIIISFDLSDDCSAVPSFCLLVY